MCIVSHDLYFYVYRKLEWRFQWTSDLAECSLLMYRDVELSLRATLAFSETLCTNRLFRVVQNFVSYITDEQASYPVHPTPQKRQVGWGALPHKSERATRKNTLSDPTAWQGNPTTQLQRCTRSYLTEGLRPHHPPVKCVIPSALKLIITGPQ